MQDEKLKQFRDCILEANQALDALSQHLQEWQKEKTPTPENIMNLVEKQQALLTEAENKTNQLKHVLLNHFSDDQSMEKAISNLEIILEKPEAHSLSEAWQAYQQHLTECLAYNQKNSAQISRALPFVHHLLHLFLGHEQEVVVYNAKGKKSSDVHKAS